MAVALWLLVGTALIPCVAVGATQIGSTKRGRAVDEQPQHVVRGRLTW
jgi:hypothetical protein